MLESIIGKKIELMPKIPKDNEILCDKCGGTGWLLKDNKWLETCECGSGLVPCCPGCNKPYQKRYYHQCENEECRAIERAEKNNKEILKEQERFDKAITYSMEDAPKEIIEMMYSEIYGYNEGYINDIGELEEYVEDNELEKPKYVWATYKTKISIDSESIVEQACDDLHEDVFGNIVNLTELQEFLDEWCKKQKGTETYYPDYRYAILL